MCITISGAALLESEENLIRIYNSTLEERRRSGTASSARSSAVMSLNDREKAMHGMEKLQLLQRQRASPPMSTYIADNCSVNKLVADLLEVPHIGCASHKLHLEVRRMIERDRTLEQAIDSIHDSKDSDLHLDRRITFKNKVERYEMQLKDIKSVTLDLQKKGLTPLGRHYIAPIAQKSKFRVWRVERLWSVAKNILIDNRKETTPLVFEALLFLKVNQDYWNDQTVKKAMPLSSTDIVDRLMQQDEEHIDLVGSG
eukprot:IDg8450t1